MSIERNQANTESECKGTPWSGYQFSYSYDATGNPVEQNKNGLVYSNSFNNLNQNAEGTKGTGPRKRKKEKKNA